MQGISIFTPRQRPEPLVWQCSNCAAIHYDEPVFCQCGCARLFIIKRNVARKIIFEHWHSQFCEGGDVA